MGLSITDMRRQLRINRAQAPLAIVDRLPGQLLDEFRTWRAAVRRIWGNADLTPEGQTRQVERARSEASGRVETLIEAALQARSAAEAALDEAAEPPTASADEATLRELQLQRAWARIERRLAHEPLLVVAQQEAAAAAARGDRATFAALREELPARLGSGRQAEADLAELLEILAREEEPTLTAVQLSARRQLEQLRERWGRLQQVTISQLRAELAGRAVVSVLVDGDGVPLDVPIRPEGFPTSALLTEST